MAIIIPKGKEIILYNQEKRIIQDENVHLILEEDITLTLSSTFAPIIDNSAPKLGVLVASVTKQFGYSISGAIKETGFQLWEKTDPIRFSCTVGLYMKDNALDDVMTPAMTLMKIPLPEDLGYDNAKKKGVGLVPPGPSLLDAFDATRGRGLNYWLDAGAIQLKPIIIKQVEPTFSIETDTENYPIWCKLRMDIETIFTATTNMIDDFYFKSSNRKLPSS